jgi:hypothetical protein
MKVLFTVDADDALMPGSALDDDTCMDCWYTAYENLVIEEFAQRSMCALLERFFFAWRSLAAVAAGLSTRVSYTFFFFWQLLKKANNPTLFSECRPACPIREPAG